MVAVVDIAAAVAVVVLHRVDMVVVDTQEGAAGQQVIVVPCPQDDPVRIASHSSYAALGVPAVAVVTAAVVVLRFPLFYSIDTRLMRLMLFFVAALYLFLSASSTDLLEKGKGGKQGEYKPPRLACPLNPGRGEPLHPLFPMNSVACALERSR